MNKHTEGEWIIEHARINQGGKKYPYVMSVVHNCCIGRIAGNTDEEAEANATLIAESPALLGICDVFAELIDRQYGKDGYFIGTQAVDTLNRIIAKAKGG